MNRTISIRNIVAATIPAALLLLAGCGLLEERPDPPDPPADVRASQDEYAEQIVVVWSEVEGADSYQVLRARNDNEYTPLGDPVDKTLYQDTDAVSGSYWYKVVACSGGVCSVASEEATGTAGAEGAAPRPLPPTGVRATDGSHTDRVVISWDAVSDNAEYVVFRSQESAGGPFEEIGTSDGTTLRDTDVERGRKYWYRVRSEEEARRSMKSAVTTGYALPEHLDHLD